MEAKIYKLICPINNIPIYIGQTIKSLEARLYKHIYKTKTKIKKGERLSRNENWIKKLINLSIEKDIKIELIEECNLHEVHEKEKYWISTFRIKYKLNNLTDGGEGCLSYRHDNESIMKISKNRKGKCIGSDHPNYGKNLSDETKKKISSSVKGENHPNYGKNLSDETKEKIGYANFGEKNGMYGKTYEMSEETKNKISNKLKNSDKLKISRNSEEYKKKLSDYFSIPIILYDSNMNPIIEFKNCRECASYLGCTVSNIKNAVRDGRMVSRKFWIKRKSKD